MNTKIQELADSIRDYKEARVKLLKQAKSLEATIIEDFRKKHPEYYIDGIIFGSEDMVQLYIKEVRTDRLVDKCGILYSDYNSDYSYEFNDPFA